ncbi:FAD-dependent oxidoreductase [Petroclostridium sp. X23]|uniref:NAD(P)/FAD-dependent oxidoreductase n=1 Tax=Petroclostridium sp. X23 TaxID=3045146 RepID=UPI0024AC9E4D|nr:FAD-dependent oxidoreductase [Petroclostridium sp. X23]WHH58130.1 FAD-dependent oxidoreductase [Petroclostridium sp. X23]
MSRLFADAVIIGGGVAGTAITYYLSKTGLKPILVEQKNLNAGASGSCDEGVILQSKNPGIILDMAIRSAALYKNLEKELNYDIGYRNVGGMIVINDEKYVSTIENFVQKQYGQGLNICMLDYDDTHRQQPGLAENVIASAYNQDDCSVYPFRLTLGYVRAAEKLGARFLPHNKVTKLSTIKGRITHVITNQHEISTPTVINAAGCNVNNISGMLEIELPVFPVRGQIVITEPVPHIVRHQIMDARFIVAKHQPQLLDQNSLSAKLHVGLTVSQAPTGNLIIGGCREKVGYDTNITFTAVREIIKNASSFFPFCKNVCMLRTFAGLRPATLDNLPILSKTPISGFYIAGGLGGDGLSLSPIVGKIMSELVVNEKCDIVEMSQLSLERF